MTIYAPALPRDEGPLYAALADAIERDVEGGVLQPGQRLPTHRDMADALGLNVSTVTRGYREAEKRGLVSGTVGRGTFVASDATTSTSLVSFEPGAPGMLELGLAAPLSHLNPDLGEGLKRLARRKDPGLFTRYTDPRGLPEHRAAGAAWAGRYGMEVGTDRIVVCAGSQHGLTCCLSGLFRPGDRVATDSLTYPGLKTLAAMLGIRLVPVAMDGEGMEPGGLDAACRRHPIKGVYLMPTVHNPTTVTMPASRRDEIARLIRYHDLLVVEDDAYALTVPQRQGFAAPTPVSDRVRERSVLIAGMSKALAAGLRVGFLAASRPLVRPLAQAVLNTMWMAPSLNVELAAMWVDDGTADQVVARKRQVAARRYMLACDVLEGHRFRGKRGGYFLWLDLPDHLTGRELEAAAARVGVNLFGAEKFAVGEAAPPRAARISLTGTDSLDELRTGLVAVRDLLA